MLDKKIVRKLSDTKIKKNNNKKIKRLNSNQVFND